MDLKNSNSNSDGCPICNCILLKYFSCSSFFFCFYFLVELLRNEYPYDWKLS